MDAEELAFAGAARQAELIRSARLPARSRGAFTQAVLSVLDRLGPAPGA